MRRKTGSVQSRGTSWRISYYDVNSIRQFESFTSEEDARRELAARLAAVAAGVPVSSKPNTVRFGELAVDVVNEYKVLKRASLDDLETRLRLHILPVFGQRKAAQITTGHLTAYIVGRQAETPTPADGTINRELEAISHIFHLAYDNGRILKVPKVPHLPENNTRSGFFSREQVERLCSFLDAPLDSLVMFGFLTGWRLGEVRRLKWSDVDLQAGEIRLQVGTTKNKEGRLFPMTDELRDLLCALVPKQKTLAGSHVFLKDGKAVGAFRKSWKTACYKAGIPCVVAPVKKGGKKGAVKVISASRTFHDLRRSFAREMDRQGIRQGAVMKLAGWKTDTVYRRYNIVSDSDLRDAIDKMNGARNGAKRTG